ncbi:hypothetical protein, partial [Acinetobacter baumannii]|uniref:hypothetical protein n=1 Tax=Acinetobacter baumannii TaxID=470 RepID=UPI00148F02F7
MKTYGKFNVTVPSLDQFTACYWLQVGSELFSRSAVILSYATSTQDNMIVLEAVPNQSLYHWHVDGLTT